jgi:hypothetical protein
LLVEAIMHQHQAQHERRSATHPLRRPGDYLPDGVTRRRRWSRPERYYRLTYRRRPFATVLATLAAVLVTAVIASAAGTIGTSVTPTERKTKAVTWAWSDGPSGSERRVFVADDYAKGELPTIVVRAPKDREFYYLQFKQDGEWNTEWIARAENGRASLVLDPFCENGTWCDGAYEYRIKGPNASQVFLVEYWEHDS